MPRIETKSLAQHREWRRNQLIEAAVAIALESGGQQITVAAVAARAGLSRTSVYEYFASSADLVADLVIDELKTLAISLERSIEGMAEPFTAIEAWIATSLAYIAGGQHLLAKAINAVDLPRERAAEIGAAHRALLVPLRQNLETIGITDIGQALALLQSATDVATKRIEAGGVASTEIAKTSAFCIAGLKALV